MSTWLAILVLDYPWLGGALVFILGAIVGSFLNVCIYRLPTGQSVFWPRSRCASCHQPIRWYDNIPLVSYWVLRGKCRQCGSRFSMRYFWVELLTAMLFAGLFWFVVLRDGHGFTKQTGGVLFTRDELRQWDSLQPEQRLRALQEKLALRLWGVWCYDVVLVALLLVATFTDIDTLTIPLKWTVGGTVVGLGFGAVFSWPWPLAAEMPSLSPWEKQLAQYGGLMATEMVLPVPIGVQPWPFWYPLPDWLPVGAWWTGLVTAVLGAGFGTVLLRLIRAVFSWAFRKEALGLGDADLMMLIGAFLGWQGVVLTLALAVFLALGYGVLLWVIARSREMPFGPFLAGGALITQLANRWLLPPLQGLFFDLPLLLLLGAALVVLSVFLALVLRMLALVFAAE